MKRAAAVRGGLAGLGLLAVIVVAACGDNGDSFSIGELASPIAREAEDEGRCQAVEEPKPRAGNLERPASLDPTPGTVTFETSCGAFAVELDTDGSPKTTASVEFLVGKGFYNGLTIHRVVTDYLIQGGDPRGDGTGGPGYFIEEPPAKDTTYPRWTVAMAKTEDDPSGRSGSQFFVVLADDAQLEPDQAVMGKVVDGFESVERIDAIGPPGGDGEPATTVTIEKATFTPDD